MRITYDSEADAIAINLVEGKKSASTQQISPRMLVDFDEEGNPISIELLYVSKFVADPTTVEFIDLVKEALHK